MALHMAEKNRQGGQDLDRIFMQRKQREVETTQTDEQIAKIHESIQRRINDLEPGKLRAYNELMSRQKELQERFFQCEHRLNEVNNFIRSYESDDKSNALRKEYLALERQIQGLKKDSEALQEELDIANLDPKDAHTKFVARVNAFKQGAKALEDKAVSMREEIAGQRRSLEDLQSSQDGGDSEDTAKYELLVKRDQDMTTFIDKFDESKAGILSEQRESQFLIVALLEHIGKGLEDSTAMPSQEAVEEMETAKAFKEKNLATAQRTMESLVAEKKKREREMEMLRSSEPKLLAELSSLRESMSRMRGEMEEFQDLERMRREFNQTKNHLSDLKSNYIKVRWSRSLFCSLFCFRTF
jgi:chromosome segregation ATPase